jgi:hypothetical protein
MYEWLDKSRENLEEELQSGYHTALKLASMPIFKFGTEHRFLITSVWVLLLLEVVMIHNCPR